MIAQKEISSPGVHFELVIKISSFYERGTYFAIVLPLRWGELQTLSMKGQRRFK